MTKRWKESFAAFFFPNLQGVTIVRKKAGAAYVFGAIITFGLSALCGSELKDTYHYCQQCNECVAFAKLS